MSDNYGVYKCIDTEINTIGDWVERAYPGEAGEWHLGEMGGK